MNFDLQTFRFKLGDRVTIIQIIDGMTAHDLIGHVGVIEELETFPNNYYVQCETCGASHYMHDAELELTP